MDMTLFRTTRRSGFVGRLSALSALALTSTFALQAQSLAPGNIVAAESPVQLAANDTPGTLDLAYHAGVDYSSSSSSLDGVDSTTADRLDLAVDPSANQPPPRRRYGRPRYNDSSHNPDGSSKYGFLAGAGLTLPVGDTYHYFNTSYGFQVGGGRNFNKKFSVNLQFDWDKFGINGATLGSQQNLYNYYCTSADAQAGLCPISGLDGSNHIWSFSVDPTYNFYQGDKLGAYGVVGVGFYHKVTTFTVPTVGAVETLFGPIEYEQNENFDHYTSNAPGFNGGFGLTYKPSKFSNQRLYAEARYVFVDNSQRTGITYNSSTTLLNTYTGYNDFPQNSNRTTYIPIKFGIRF